MILALQQQQSIWSTFSNALMKSPLVHEFVEWLKQALFLVFDRIIIPAAQTMKQQSAPLVDYLSNQTQWFIPFAVITWYGPSVILVILQCIFTLVLILVKVRKLFV